MSKIGQWLVIVLVAGAVALGATYLFEPQNTPSTEETLEGEGDLELQQETSAATSTDEQSSADAVIIDRDLNKPIQNSTLSEVEQNIISQWQLSLGRSLEFHETYKLYDKGTLHKLGSQGDIFALQQISIQLQDEGRRLIARQMLAEAAARGSTEALIMMGNRLQSVRQSAEVINGTYNDADIRKDYRLLHGITVKNALVRSAAAHYIVAGIRGDRYMAETNLKNLQDMDGTPFDRRKWRQLISDAEDLYKTISKRREQRGLAAFDNRYPVEYAKLNGYSQENNFFEELKEKYKNEL